MRGRFIGFVFLMLLVACGYNTPAPLEPPPPPVIEEPQPLPEPPAPEPKTEPEPKPEPPVVTTYALSDLLWESSSNTYGPFEKDLSNGGKEGGDGLTLTINGKTYSKGLGMTAPAELVFNLGGVCSSFSAEVGVDDQYNAPLGSVVFEIYADDVKLWDSGLMTTVDPSKATGDLDLTGKQRLKLVITDGGDGELDDYADWAVPTLTCDPAPPALAPKEASSQGVFGPVETWPTIPTHAALLPDSSIVAWYSRDTDGMTRTEDYNNQALHNSTIVDVWAVNSNSHNRADNTTTDLFCAGFTLNSDGNLYVAGGNLGSSPSGFYPGSRFTNVFDVTNHTWTQGPTMTEGRWYPSVIALPNKELLIMGGDSNETTLHNFIPDVWDPTTNTLRRLTSASTQKRNVHPFYPWLHVAPNGQVFYSGSSTTMAYLNTSGKGSWGTSYTRDSIFRGYGSSVMYEPGKILVMGGGGNTKTAVTIDLNGGVQAKATTSMTHGRTSLNATLLADGSVFVNGGNTSGTNFDDTTSVLTSEIWSPSTGTWQLAALAHKPRNYHSVALLLPDGRVWTAGGGGCGSCKVNQQSAEIYYPPYLFKKDGSGLLADRPTITDAPNSMSYNESYTLSTPAPDKIEKAALVALGSVTHAFNMNQRYVPLTIEGKTSSTLSITSPENANLAPPGYYMLFVIDINGVPSLARIVQVQ